MEKMFNYLMSEYHHSEQDMYQLFGDDYRHLKEEIKNNFPNGIESEVEEKLLFTRIDNFMADRFQENKRRRRAY